MLRVVLRTFRCRTTAVCKASPGLIQLPDIDQHVLSRHAISGLLSLANPEISVQSFQCRTYISEMRKSAFESKILRLLRNEIQYELDSSPIDQRPSDINKFKIDDQPGERWIRLLNKFGRNEEIKVEVTNFDGSVPVQNPGDGDDKNAKVGEEVVLRISLIISIFKENGDQVLEFVCSAWPDSVEIDQVFVRDCAEIPDQPHFGPPFKELDDALQDSLYQFLEERGIDDSLCVFLHEIMHNKERSEYIRWMERAKSFIEQRAA